LRHRPHPLATHGKPEERSAHPHLDGPGRVAVVQYGMIENHRTLREELQAEGTLFREYDLSLYPADQSQRP
jgi:glucosamine 6-phosphate synthetase-like amidotransferase/phosphosugar isomerase protein